MHVKRIAIGESVADTRDASRGVEHGEGEFRGKRVTTLTEACPLIAAECCITSASRCGSSAFSGSDVMGTCDGVKVYFPGNTYHLCKDAINPDAFDEDLSNTGAGRSKPALKVADGACTDHGAAVFNGASPDYCPPGFGNYTLVAAGLATAPPPSIPNPTPAQNDQANSRVLQNAPPSQAIALPSAPVADASIQNLRGSTNGIPKASERTAARVQETLSWDEAQQILATRGSSASKQSLVLSPSASLLTASPLLAITAATTTGVVVTTNTAAIATGAAMFSVMLLVLGGAIYFAVRAFKKQKETATRVAPMPEDLGAIENQDHDDLALIEGSGREDSRPDSARSLAALDEIAELAKGNISVARAAITQATHPLTHPMRRTRSTLSIEHCSAIAAAFHSNKISHFFDESFDDDCRTIRSAYYGSDHDESDAEEINPEVVQKLNAAFANNIPPPKKLKVLPPIPHIPPPEAFV